MENVDISVRRLERRRIEKLQNKEYGEDPQSNPDYWMDLDLISLMSRVTNMRKMCHPVRKDNSYG